MLNDYGQKGFSDRMLLFAFVVLFIIAIIALPKYLKWRETAGLPPEVLTLRRIAVAEAKYRSKISLKNAFGSFKQLADTGLLPETCADCDENVRSVDGFRLELNRNYEETRFCVIVTGSKKFAMDTDGRIFESEAGNVGCSAGEVTGANLKEFRK